MKTLSPFPSVRRTQPPFRPVVHTAKTWDAVRTAFSSSILVDTPLTSLAQNLEGVDWPLRGREETPAAYIDLTFEEMRERLALRGQSPHVGDQLIDLLKQTLAFDDPFGEMLSTHGGPGEENPLVKNLSKLGIPAAFPVSLTTLSSDTLLLCRLEGVGTLGEFALLAQRLAGAVIVGGDFRALLNALSSVDEKTIARFLPFRPGTAGLHYVEGLGQAVCSQPVEIQAALARQAGEKLTPALHDLACTVSSAQLAAARADLLRMEAELRPFCTEERDALRRRIEAGADPRGLFSILGDPLIEAVAAGLVAPDFKTVNPGLLARLTRWWRRK